MTRSCERFGAATVLAALVSLVAAAPSGNIRGATSPAGGGQAPDGRTIMQRYDQAHYYAGRDMKASVVMELGSGDRATKQRAWTFLRLTSGDDGEQMYLLYFHKPIDVRRMSCMIRKHPKLRDERWMFVPASGRVLRVQASDRSSFLGSEFVREEFSGRDVDADVHSLIRTEVVGGRECYVVQSVPKARVEFSKCLSWIDRATYLPLRQEYYNERGELSRVFTGARIVDVASREHPRRTYPTLMERTMRRPAGRWTRVELDSVSYDIGLRAEDFSEGRMQEPVSDWLH